MTVESITVDQIGDRWAYRLDGFHPDGAAWILVSRPIYRSRSSARRRAKLVASWVVSGRTW